MMGKLKFCVKILEIILIYGSLFAVMSYQIWLLSEVYNYGVIPSIDLEDSEYVDLPAVHICIPTHLAFKWSLILNVMDSIKWQMASNKSFIRENQKWNSCVQLITGSQDQNTLYQCYIEDWIYL